MMAAVGLEDLFVLNSRGGIEYSDCDFFIFLIDSLFDF